MINIPFTSLQMLIGGAVFVALLLCILVLPAKAKSGRAYEQRPSVLTPPEKYFYNVLSSIYKDRFIILAKVRIADIIKVRSTIGRKQFWGYFSKISQKHIDFLLVDRESFATLCAIELDDKSHEKRVRQTRDKFVNHVMAQTDIPLYRFKVKRIYDRAEIAQTLNQCLK